MSKNLLLALALIVILTTAYLTLIINAGDSALPSKSEVDVAVNQAKFLYQQEKSRGRDFSSGPCLSNALMPNWVLDISHNPRLPSDDLPENQCSAYLEGGAGHFVELDPEGNLIRAK